MATLLSFSFCSFFLFFPLSLCIVSLSARHRRDVGALGAQEQPDSATRDSGHEGSKDQRGYLQRVQSDTY